jgi:hypothetical protein
MYIYVYMLIIPPLCRRGTHIAVKHSWIFEKNDKLTKWKKLLSEKDDWENEVFIFCMKKCGLMYEDMQTEELI